MVVARWNAPPPQPADPGEPRNLDEALAWLNDNAKLKRQRAAEWLGKQTVDPGRKADVKENPLDAFNDSRDGLDAPRPLHFVGLFVSALAVYPLGLLCMVKFSRFHSAAKNHIRAA